MPIYTFDAESMRLIAEQVRQMKQRLRSLEADFRSHQRRRTSVGTSSWVGTVDTAAIAPNTDGQIIIYDDSAGQWTPTTEVLQVTNPHDIQLEIDDKVRADGMKSWAKPLVAPYEYVECEEVQPLPVGPVVS